jgi:4-carboxymuconolactone decarboxylase
MSRLDPPAPSIFSAAQREVNDAIAAGPRGRVAGPLGIWLWRPELAQRAQTLGQYCRYDSSLPKRLSELAILVTGRYWGAEYEWQHHKPIALGAGINETVVDAICKQETPTFTKMDEQIVYDFATSLYKTRGIPDELYQSAIDTLGLDSVVDLVGVLGYYAFISMTINVFKVPADGENELS